MKKNGGHQELVSCLKDRLCLGFDQLLLRCQTQIVIARQMQSIRAGNGAAQQMLACPSLLYAPHGVAFDACQNKIREVSVVSLLWALRRLV
ncbi:hypothetical protein D3C85_1009180 [compost metagenome]